MLAELRDDNKALAERDARGARRLCDEHEDVADRQPARSLHRRDRAPRLVPVTRPPMTTPVTTVGYQCHSTRTTRYDTKTDHDVDRERAGVA